MSLSDQHVQCPQSICCPISVSHLLGNPAANDRSIDRSIPLFSFPLFFDISTSVVENVVLRYIALYCVVLRCVWIPFPIAVFLIPDSTASEMPQKMYSLLSLSYVFVVPVTLIANIPLSCAVLCCAVL